MCFQELVSFSSCFKPTDFLFGKIYTGEPVDMMNLSKHVHALLKASLILRRFFVLIAEFLFPV